MSPECWDDRAKALPSGSSPLAINDVICEVIALLHSQAMKVRVSVQMDLAAGLPAVQGDRVQLQQVILNLIINAIQAMSGVTDATRDLHIAAASGASEGTRVMVRDSGPGLRTDDVERLFEPFYTTKSNGLGVGLSICRTIIETHGGRLWAAPNQPRGALFQFTLPAQ